LRLLSVSRLEWKKGHQHLLDCISRLVRAGVHVELRIVGEGAFREAIEFAQRQLGLHEQVRLLGALAPSQVREQLAWADVFVHSALSEGFCNAVIEAQASGLPVVTSDAEGLRENVADGETGFVVPRRDTAAMAERIRALAGSEELRHRLARNGPERARQVFRLERQLDQWTELYNEVSR
jgi:colanic acid/amylovoran biosynthesis glycosyltransferase